MSWSPLVTGAAQAPLRAAVAEIVAALRVVPPDDDLDALCVRMAIRC